MQLDAPIEKHQLFIFKQPHLYPLARLINEYRRYAVLVADSNRARIFVFGRGRTLAAEEVQNEKMNRTEVGGWSQMRYQRHVDHLRLQHAKEVVEALDRIVREEAIESVIIAGDEVVIPVLREQMPPALAASRRAAFRVPFGQILHDIYAMSDEERGDLPDIAQLNCQLADDA